MIAASPPLFLPLLAAEAGALAGETAADSGATAALGWGGVALAIAASVFVASRIWQCESRGGTVVPGRPWPAAVWSGAAVLLVACGWLLVAALCVSLLPADAPLLNRMAAQAAGSIVATLASWRRCGPTGPRGRRSASRARAPRSTGAWPLAGWRSSPARSC